jgi:Carboxypeptidase regulatory-like domain/Tetratricopeptide repeat
MRSNPLLRTLFVALVVAASAVAASAQSTQVNGTVTLKQADGTVVPVAGAQIDIYRTDIKAEYHTKSDKKGKYIHAGLPFIGTYTVVVSAPGAAPSFLPKLRFTQQTEYNFELKPGDGSKLTLDQIKASEAAGGAGAPAGAPGAPRGESKEEKAAREAKEKEIAEIEKKNAEITASNELIGRVFKAGNDALNAGKYDEAITSYREGVAARPEEVALLTNLSEALRRRGVERFNSALKSTDNDAKTQGLDAAKKDWLEAVELSNKAVTLVKAANPAGPNVNAAGFEQNKRAAISTRALAMKLVATKVDQSQAQAAWDAFQEHIAAEADAAKKAKLRAEALQMVFDAGSTELAVTQARAVLAEDPENVDANRILGLALFATGDKAKFQEAANYLQKYVNNAPDTDPLKQSAKESLDYLKTAENVKPEKVPSRPTRRGNRP